jgi:hypothetical protein
MPRQIPYPDYICNDCGHQYGRWYASGSYTGPSDSCSTYHEGKCDICAKQNVPVTEPRDFGYLLNWSAVQHKIREKRKIRKNKNNCEEPGKVQEVDTA